LEVEVKDGVVFREGEDSIVFTGGFPLREVRQGAADGAVGVAGHLRGEDMVLEQALAGDGLAIDGRDALDVLQVAILFQKRGEASGAPVQVDDGDGKVLLRRRHEGLIGGVEDLNTAWSCRTSPLRAGRALRAAWGLRDVLSLVGAEFRCDQREHHAKPKTARSAIASLRLGRCRE
jgi:hypothetical protein